MGITGCTLEGVLKSHSTHPDVPYARTLPHLSLLSSKQFATEFLFLLYFIADIALLSMALLFTTNLSQYTPIIILDD